MKHIHRCPICEKDAECESAECKAVLETEFGDPMSYKTCENCIKNLRNEKEKNAVMLGGFKKWRN